MADELTAERLRKMLDYDPATGEFKWSEAQNLKPAGSVAGGINGRGYRLAFLHQTGEWPTEQVDHRDGNRLNNAWNNLRSATQRQNNQNTVKHRDGRLPGAHWRKQVGVWRSEIKVAGQQHFLGQFPSEAEASEAYRINAARVEAGLPLRLLPPGHPDLYRKFFYQEPVL